MFSGEGQIVTIFRNGRPMGSCNSMKATTHYTCEDGYGEGESVYENREQSRSNQR